MSSEKDARQAKADAQRKTELQQQEEQPKKTKSSRRGMFDIYAAYDPRRGQARLGVTFTISSRQPRNKR